MKGPTDCGTVLSMVEHHADIALTKYCSFTEGSSMIRDQSKLYFYLQSNLETLKEILLKIGFIEEMETT